MVPIKQFFMSLKNVYQLEVCCEESSNTAVYLKSFDKYVRQFYQQKHMNTLAYSPICCVCNVSMVTGYTKRHIIVHSNHIATF